MAWTDLKARIQRHYDVAAPMYRKAWGIHIHHGYWRDGSETKEVAQEQLTALLAVNAEIEHNSRILDIGCGFGGSAQYLARHFAAHVVGISISQKQIESAAVMAETYEPRPQFLVMDAEHLGIAATFDVIWSIEAISHLAEKTECLRQALNMLVPHGRVAIIDWFKSEDLDYKQEQRYIKPIVREMLLPELETIGRYGEILEGLNCRIVKVQDISSHVSRTWDICIEIARLPAVVRFAFAHGLEFVSFLRGFAAMKEGFGSGAFQCGMLIAEKHS